MIKKIMLHVEGMSCSHCVNAVNGAVSSLNGVLNVNVELEEKAVIVEYDDDKITLDSIKEAIEDQGYEVS
ncbi:MAG: copper chaperone CopZ [Anaerovoracaceae bacterium]|jgi:copper chaperone